MAVLASSFVAEPPLKFHLDPIVELSDDELFDLCQHNRGLRIERPAQGEIIVMSPAGGKTSDRNDAKILEKPASLAGDPELPGFVLDLGELPAPSIQAGARAYQGREAPQGSFFEPHTRRARDRRDRGVMILRNYSEPAGFHIFD